MPKKKTTVEQQELLTLLPNELPTLNQSAQLVLANIIFKYGTEYAREHGYVYRTNEDMAKDTGLSKQSVITAVRQLELLGLIESIRGRRGQASEYCLSDEIKQKINFTSTEIIDKPKEIVMESRTSKGQTNETMGQITKGQITELVNQITDAVCERMNDIITSKFKELSDSLIGSATRDKELYLTTDTDIDKETLTNINQDIDSVTESKPPYQKNQYVNEVYEWLDDQLDYLFKVKDKIVYDELNNRILQFIENIDQTQFTVKQWDVLSKKKKRLEGIERAKEQFFNRQRNKVSGSSMDNTSMDNTSMDNVAVNEYCNTSVSLNDFLSDNGSEPQKCRNFTQEEAMEWVSNEVKEFSSYESWEQHTINNFNRMFCEDWSIGYDANALSLFYTACEYAEQYYQNMDEREPQVNDEELAPWDVIDSPVFQMGKTSTGTT